MSAPTKRTPENRERLIALLGSGTTRTAAAAAVRMSRQTLNEWINDDEEFALDIEKAVQDAITRNVLLIQRAAQPRPVKKTRTEFAPKKDRDGKDTGKLVKVAQTVEEHTEEGDWRAASWILERADPDAFGRRETIKLVPPEKMPDDALVAELLAIAARLGGDRGGPEAGPHAEAATEED